MSDEPIQLADVKRLVVHPGEVLAVTLPADLHPDPDMVEQMHEAFRNALPLDVRVLIFRDGIEIAVIDGGDA